MGVPRLSGLQKQVLILYRDFLRVARSKAPEARRDIEAIVSEEFRKNAVGVEKKNFVQVEYLLNRGRKQLEMLKNSCVNGISLMKPKQFQS